MATSYHLDVWYVWFLVWKMCITNMFWKFAFQHFWKYRIFLKIHGSILEEFLNKSCITVQNQFYRPMCHHWRMLNRSLIPERFSSKYWSGWCFTCRFHKGRYRQGIEKRDKARLGQDDVWRSKNIMQQGLCRTNGEYIL